MVRIKFVNKITTHILCSVSFFRLSCLLWVNIKNIVQSDRPQITIRRLRIACWIPKATNIHPEPFVLIVFPLQQRLHKRAPMLFYTYIDHLVGTDTLNKSMRTVVSLVRNCRLVSIMRHTIEASVWNAVRYAFLHTAYHIQRISDFFKVVLLLW